MKIKSKHFLKLLIFFLSLVFFITFVCGLVYLSVQQNYRQSANDPQIQMSEDIARDLATGTETPASVVMGKSIDIAESLAPFVIIYNDLGLPVVSTARLDNKIPIIPSGVLEYVRIHGQDRITWEPKIGVREAAVITHFSGKDSGFILVGRSLREVETREDRLMLHITLSWIAAIVGVFILAAVCTIVLR